MHRSSNEEVAVHRNVSGTLPDRSWMINFFIYGYPRSGTSLVRAIINSSSEAHIPPECSFVTFFRERYSHWSSSNFQRLSAKFVRDLAEARKFETWNVSDSDIIEAISRIQPTHYAELCGVIYRLHARYKSSTCLIGDKNNVHIFCRASLQQLFPESLEIFVIRDPRAVYSSIQTAAKEHRHIRYAPKAEINAKTFCNKWIDVYEEILRVPKPNQLVVRYEDLVSEPHKSITQMFQFLALDCSRLDLANPRTLHLVNIDEPASTMPWKEHLATEISAERLLDWRYKLSTNDFEEISNHLLPIMRALNYVS